MENSSRMEWSSISSIPSRMECSPSRSASIRMAMEWTNGSNMIQTMHWSPIKLEASVTCHSTPTGNQPFRTQSINLSMIYSSSDKCITISELVECFAKLRLN